MTKQEAMRLTQQENVLQQLGFTQSEAEALRRISMTLQRWYELECGDGNGHIERDEKTGKPRYYNARARYVDPKDPRAWHVVADREAGAKRRLAAIIERRNSYGDIEEHANGGCTINARKPVAAFIQSDPRGAALYILRPGDVPAGQTADSCYSRGICVY